MLLGAILLLTVGTGAFVVLDPGSPHASESLMTVQWVANANEDPSVFNIELYSPTFNSVNLLGQHVPTSANEFTVTFPPLPASNDYIFWFVNPANASNVYANSVSFSVVAAAQKSTAQGTTSSPTKAASPPTTAGPPPPSTPLPGHSLTSPLGTSTAPLSTPFSTPTSLLSSPSGVPGSSQSPPLSQSVQLSSGLSGEVIQPPPTLAAAVQSSKKPTSAGVIAGSVIGVVVLLVLFALVLLRLRSARRREDPELRPHGYPATLRDEEPSFRDPATNEKTDPIPSSTSRSASFDGEGTRWAALTAQSRTVQEQPAALNNNDHDGREEPIHRNATLRAHVETFEREMQSQHHPPPGYLD
ncbi:hypothetical protein C8F04DRAFT_1133818 [Mycena alexandri]|uniref:Uncharacterized protein n=1 Tax=Mycena alexandri TaxID=1745969 RepID=A0AAD6SAD5_9AGAR|nr:hypothetical protein C8F04DRAFT_1133818 [Mycena alexandri]